MQPKIQKNLIHLINYNESDFMFIKFKQPIFNVIYKNKSYSTIKNVTGGLKIVNKQSNNPRLLLKIPQSTV